MSCKYCGSEDRKMLSCIEKVDVKNYIIILDGELISTVNAINEQGRMQNNVETKTSINYCPICGRSLNDEL